MGTIRYTGIALLVGATLGCATTYRDIPGVPSSGFVPEGVYHIPAHTFEITSWSASKVPNGSYQVPAHTLVVAPRSQVHSELQKRRRERGYGQLQALSLGEFYDGFYDITKNEIWCPDLDLHACYYHEREHKAHLVDENHKVTIGKYLLNRILRPDN